MQQKVINKKLSYAPHDGVIFFCLNFEPLLQLTEKIKTNNYQRFDYSDIFLYPDLCPD